ncbi:MAG: carboxypeptidase regulatory-like domain-containing protein [Armatimonadota bacterium]
MRKLTRLSLVLLVTGASIVHLTGCGGVSQAPPADHSQVMVHPAGSGTLLPLELAWPDTPRWMDIADQSYSDDFASQFSYGSQVSVTYEDSASTLAGTLTATGLKPWFAYQMKLVGTEGIKGTDEAANDTVESWSSYQLGTVGRWWCDTCGWNLSDAEVQQHVDDGHTVVGYLLFDWFVTDASGYATHDFALDSSFHVLWKDSQRRRRPQDSPPVNYQVVRDTYAYPSEVVGTRDKVTIYAEWEQGRPKPGDVQLAAGDYVVSFNLTEETFHNVPPDLASDFPWGYTNYPDGGFWAKVLGGNLSFAVSGGGNGEEPTGTGAIEGTVTYGDGSVARKADVTLTDADSVAVASTQTRGNGVYKLSDVPEGTGYTVTAEQGGLSASESGVVVTAGQTTTVDLTL